MKKLSNFFTNKKIVVIIILCIIFGIAFSINYNTIWCADDYAFYNNAWSETTEFSLNTAVSKANVFYTGWTGRYVSTLLNYIIIYFNKNIFNILNSLMFTAMIFLIYKIGKTEKEENPKLLILSFLLVWFIMPSLGEVAFWQIGSIIYLWTFVSVLIVVYLFMELLKKHSIVKKGFGITLLLFIFGIIVGNGFETNSLMLVCFEIIAIGYIKFIRKEKVPIWAIVLLISTTIGFATNFFAPGNSARMESMKTSNSIIDIIKYGAGGVFFRGVLQGKIYIAVSASILLYSIFITITNRKKMADKKTVISVISILVIAIIFIGLLFALIGHFSGQKIEDFLGWFYESYLKFDASIFVLICVALAFIVTLFLSRKKIFNESNKDINGQFLIIFMAAIIGVCSYMVTSLAWPRSYMGMSGFLIISICIMISSIRDIKTNKIAENIIISIFAIIYIISYSNVITELISCKRWELNTKKQIEASINEGKEVIDVETYMSTNPYNAASVEKWVIPVIMEDDENVTENGISKDYEWINIAITNYYFKGSNAWSEGKRIIGH